MIELDRILLVEDNTNDVELILMALGENNLVNKMDMIEVMMSHRPSRPAKTFDEATCRERTWGRNFIRSGLHSGLY
ncbi:hypothetical protein [Acetobacterium tundrae]|uniref:Stage 0 sporulation protein A homolog n=1 Tax=Acetobacterium tundrae TaxID=132932 RepID=A0ABR6WMJ9_9FIRM|nr:hypothetical protein [Acetobacterium tundrae]MBC3797709.1 hypothetical protein [Acetobacterium tundrae]